MKNYLMEFVGTFFLVLTIALTGDPMIIGIMLTALVYMGGHVSGAHYNPAVTIAFLMRGKMESRDVPGYMVAQIFGAFLATLFSYWFQGNIFTVAAGAGVGIDKVLAAEILFTFVLVLVILNVATTRALEGNYIYGVAIGFTVWASAYAVGGISGAALNPAVSIGPALFAATQGVDALGNVWLYILGPVAGGVIATLLFTVFNPDDA